MMVIVVMIVMVVIVVMTMRMMMQMRDAARQPRVLAEHQRLDRDRHRH